jgi:hypothetical protein
MKRFLRDNGLSVTMFALSAVFVLGLSVAGAREQADEDREHGQPPSSYVEYVTSGDFGEAVLENWESEFLQMGCYVLFTIWLIQRGSSESKDPDSDEPVDEDPRDHQNDSDAPGPVRKGGALLRLYEHSLSAALLTLFTVSLLLHAWTGSRAYNQEQELHGGSTVSATAYVTTARFWEEAFQNWQSEFFAIGVLLVLSIRLRDRGSPESKPVHASHAATGK